MGDLTKNFSKHEFLCKCGCGKGGNEIDDKLIDALQDLRNLIGLPITITDGYRCQAAQDAINKRENREGSFSYHTCGMAVDILIKNHDPLHAYYVSILIKPFEKGGIGLYPASDKQHVGSLHLDLRTTGPSRWSRVNGVYRSLGDGITVIRQQRSIGYYK